MATARLYADENFKRAAVEELHRLGHDVLTVQEAGQQGGNDPHVLAYATALGRGVLTFNRRHFIRLHLQSPAHAGIIVCTDDDAMALAARIDQSIQADPSLAGKLIRVNRPRKQRCGNRERSRDGVKGKSWPTRNSANCRHGIRSSSIRIWERG